MMDINTISLNSLPASETDDLEYKSSLINDNKLKQEIQNAASAFWNGGGGVFIAGVDNKGEIDGGIVPLVGRQSREDWLSQIMWEVKPQGTYSARMFDQASHPKIQPDKRVLAITFDASTATPHQSADSRYYIRAGAHTVPAPHFIVESLYAKRHFRSPTLVHTARIENWTVVSDFLVVEIIAATDGVAHDVEINFGTQEYGLPIKLPLPLTVPVIDREHPFAFRFEVTKQPPFVATIKVTYRDFANKSYCYESRIDASKCIIPWNRVGGELEGITKAINELRREVERINRGF